MAVIIGPTNGEAATDQALIVFDGTVAELHGRQADITEHEVEEGADVSDHIRLRPIEITIEAIVSASPMNSTWSLDRPLKAWEILTGAVGTGQLFTVSTELETYANMAIQEISNRQAAEFAIRPTVIMRQVRIVAGATVGLPEVVVPSLEKVPKRTEQQNEGNQPTEPADPRSERLQAGFRAAAKRAVQGAL